MNAVPTPASPWRTALPLLLVLAVPLQGQEQTTTVLTGEVRVRSEAARPLEADPWQNFTLLRTRIGVRADVNPNLRVLVQIQDSRAFGEETSPTAGTANQLDLHQGYAELAGQVRGAELSLRAGRQQMGLGSERLVGPSNWSNTARSFDAARLDVAPTGAGWSATAFLATVHESHARYRADTMHHLEQDHWFTGVFAGGPASNLYALYSSNASQGAFRGVDRTTLGGRLEAPASAPVLASVEAAYQFGGLDVSGESAARQDIGAHFALLRLGTLTGSVVVPSLGLGLDYLSGDDPQDGNRFGAFNTLYATNHSHYGTLDLMVDSNGSTRQNRGLVDAMLNARAGLGGLGALDIALHRFAVAEATDLDGDVLGWELDLTYPFRLAGAARFTLGYSTFWNGVAAPAVGLGADGTVRHWVFLQGGVAF